MTELMYVYSNTKNSKKKGIARGHFWGRNLGDRAEEASVFLLSVGYYLSSNL